MKIAVVLRKDQSGVGIADEHDRARIAHYLKVLNARHGTQFSIITPAERGSLTVDPRSDGYLFIGTDDFTRRFLTDVSDERPVFIWAKAFNLCVDAAWEPLLAKTTILFNSCYTTGVEDRPPGNVQYLPTAFHDPWPVTPREVAIRARNWFAGPGRFDLVFSGSGRFVRKDQYRQRLLNRLAEMGLRICIAAPAHAWAPSQDGADPSTIPLHPSIRLLGNWGSPGVFRRAKYALDLPWLDTILPPTKSGRDPNGTVWSLGWNIFRMGAYGANILAHDCPAIRNLGLHESNCTFYRGDFRDLDALADEIYERVTPPVPPDAEAHRRRVHDLFHSKHRYIDRWDHMYREIAKAAGPRNPEIQTEGVGQ